MAIILWVLPVSFIIAYWYLRHLNKYWERRHINGPKPIPLFGNLKETGSVFNQNFVQFLHKWTKQYGKVYGIQRGLWNALIISDMNMVKELLVDKFEDFNARDHTPMGNNKSKDQASSFISSGPKWKRMRSILSPIFSNQNIRTFIPAIDRCAKEAAEALVEVSKKAPDQEINVLHYFQDFNTDSTLNITVSVRDDPQRRREILGTLKHVSSISARVYFFYSWMVPYGQILLQCFQMASTFMFNLGFVRFIFMMNKFAKERIKEMKANPKWEPKDIMGKLVRFSTEEPIVDLFDAPSVKQAAIVKSSTFDEAIGQTGLFFFAGFDTVANTASFVNYHLAQDPEVQERLRDEINEVIGDEELTYENLSQLKYADAVIKETLRFHPAGAHVEGRRAVRPTKIGNVELEVDTDVIVDVFAIHSDPELWGEDVEKYRPERFLDDSPSHAFLGFGMGPRGCAGIRLAFIQQKIILIHILRRFRIEKATLGDNSTAILSSTIEFPEAVATRLVPLKPVDE